MTIHLVIKKIPYLNFILKGDKNHYFFNIEAPASEIREIRETLLRYTLKKTFTKMRLIYFYIFMCYFSCIMTTKKLVKKNKLFNSLHLIMSFQKMKRHLSDVEIIMCTWETFLSFLCGSEALLFKSLENYEDFKLSFYPIYFIIDLNFSNILFAKSKNCTALWLKILNSFTILVHIQYSISLCCEIYHYTLVPQRHVLKWSVILLPISKQWTNGNII